MVFNQYVNNKIRLYVFICAKIFELMFMYLRHAGSSKMKFKLSVNLNANRVSVCLPPIRCDRGCLSSQIALMVC